MDSDPDYLRAKFRMQAIYHTCMSTACFKREDAITKEAPESAALRIEAAAYEQAASWINEAIKSR